MKTFMKTSGIAVLALAMTTFGAPQARAGGWCVAGGVLGGLAVGTAIGASVACATTPVYYSYPAPVYAAPTYYAPGPAAVTVAAGPGYCYGPGVVCAGPYGYYPYGRPYVRAGFGWGHPYYGYRGRYYRR